MSVLSHWVKASGPSTGPSLAADTYQFLRYLADFIDTYQGNRDSYLGYKGIFPTSPIL